MSGSDVAMESSVTSDSLRPAAVPTVPAKPVKLRRNVPLAVLILVYALLLASVIGLTVLLMLLGCQLSCTGYGLGAVLITALGLGVVGVLSYFWGRVMTSNLIRIKVPAERSQTARRYQRAWLAATLGLTVAQVFFALTA